VGTFYQFSHWCNFWCVCVSFAFYHIFRYWKIIYRHPLFDNFSHNLTWLWHCILFLIFIFDKVDKGGLKEIFLWKKVGGRKAKRERHLFQPVFVILNHISSSSTSCCSKTRILLHIPSSSKSFSRCKCVSYPTKASIRPPLYPLVRKGGIFVVFVVTWSL